MRLQPHVFSGLLHFFSSFLFGFVVPFVIIIPSYFFSFLFLSVILSHLFCFVFLLFLLFSLSPILSFVFHYLHRVFSTSDSLSFHFYVLSCFHSLSKHCCLRSRVDMFYARKRVMIAMLHQTIRFCPPSQSVRQDIFAYLTAFCSCFNLCTFSIFVLQPLYDIFQKQLFFI